jgi:hypothetical protein
MTQNTESHVVRAAEYLAACETKALDTQAELIEAQRRCVAATPVYCPAGDCAELVAQAAAEDAVNGTRTADILRERLICERAAAEAQRTEQREAEVAAKEAAHRHAQAGAYLRAARAGFEVAIQAAARKLAGKAAHKYGQALQALLVAHEDYIVAVAVGHNNTVSGPDLLPAIPTFGANVASAFTTTGNGHVYFPAEPAVLDRANALRAQIIASHGEAE